MIKKIFASLIFILFLSNAFSDTVHVIKKGETIYLLSKKYGVSMSTILEYNGIKDATKIVVGQKIKIPPTSSLSPKQIATQTYIVEKGDTIYGIAKKFNTTQAEIFSLNNLNTKSIIKVGQKLKVPAQVSETKPKPKLQPKPQVTPPEDVRQYSEKQANTKIMWPIASEKISYLDDKTSGVVLEGRGDDAVKAIASGTVVSSGPYRGYANVVFVKSNNDYIYVYAGLKLVDVKVGTKVAVGSKLGNLPEKALLTQSKLYFMVYKRNTSIDPALAPRGF